MPKSIYVRCYNSKKTEGASYVALVVDLGYRTHFLSFDYGFISESTGKSVADIRDMKPGDEILVGVLN